VSLFIELSRCTPRAQCTGESNQQALPRSRADRTITISIHLLPQIVLVLVLVACGVLHRRMVSQGPAALKAQGNEAFKAFKFDEAIELYSAAIAAAPDDPVYCANRSAALFEAGCYAESLAAAEAALAA
jgi:tetratricopeptide (TPR) repeat protein